MEARTWMYWIEINESSRTDRIILHTRRSWLIRQSRLTWTRTLDKNGLIFTSLMTGIDSCFYRKSFTGLTVECGRKLWVIVHLCSWSLVLWQTNYIYASRKTRATPQMFLWSMFNNSMRNNVCVAWYHTPLSDHRFVRASFIYIWETRYITTEMWYDMHSAYISD